MKRIPASIRNKNPGAMYPGRSSRKFGSTAFEILRSKDGTHKIATFPTSEHGAAAQFDLLHRSYCDRTIEKAIKKWCGGYYAMSYLKILDDKAGIKATDILTKRMVKDPDIAIPIAKAMAWQEAGRDYPLDDDEWKSAHAMAFGGEIGPAWAPDNDIPVPKQMTRVREVAKKVGKIALPVSGGIAASGPLLPKVPDYITGTITNLQSWSKAIPIEQWQVLLVGAFAFGATVLAMKALGK